jgi:hypothetical protein
MIVMVRPIDKPIHARIAVMVILSLMLLDVRQFGGVEE